MIKGDQVKIREHLEVGKLYSGLLFNKEMEKYKGMVTTVAGKLGSSIKLSIDNGEWTWNAEMLSV